MACVARYPANNFNFIRWHLCTSTVLSDLTSPLSYCALSDSAVYELPNQLIKNPKCYSPVIVSGKNISWYANLDTAINTANFNTWVLGVFDLFGNEVYTFPSSPATLKQDSYSGGTYRFYVEDISITGINPGIYYFVIYTGMTVRYISNTFRFVAASEVFNYSYLVYRNSSTAFNFNYSTLTGLLNKIYVDLNNVENQPDINKDEYDEATTGLVRSSKVRTKKIRTLEAYYFDDLAHDAMMALSAHDDIEINNIPMEVHEPYEIVPKRDFALKKGTITFFDQRVSTINLSGYDY